MVVHYTPDKCCLKLTFIFWCLYLCIISDWHNILFYSGCRADASEAAIILLPSNITVFTLDFAGSGLSGGEHVTLGWNEVSEGDRSMIYTLFPCCLTIPSIYMLCLSFFPSFKDYTDISSNFFPFHRKKILKLLLSTCEQMEMSLWLVFGVDRWELSPGSLQNSFFASCTLQSFT